MPAYTVTVTHESHKLVRDLFRLLADHNRLGAILGVPVRRVHDGQPDVNGAGSVRRIGVWPLAIEETVTAVETERRIEYRLTRGGFPIRNHRGQLDFLRTGNGSCVDWHIEFDSALPIAGSVVAVVLKRAISRGLQRIG